MTLSVTASRYLRQEARHEVRGCSWLLDLGTADGDRGARATTALQPGRGQARMELGLKDKVVILSGGSMGIGFACARAFAREGARVAMAARGEERLRQAADRIREETGADVLAVPADMTRAEDAS